MPTDSGKKMQKPAQKLDSEMGREIDHEILKTAQDLHTRSKSFNQVNSTQNQVFPSSIATFVDHTCLRPVAGEADILKTVDEAIEIGCFAVCIASSWVPFVKAYLPGKHPLPEIAAVSGFPHGNSGTEAKIQEAQWAVSQGAKEIDVVINLGRFKEGSYHAVLQELTALRTAIPHTCLKVIVETAALNELEKSVALWLCWKSGADFIKTSTGFYVPSDSTPAGATVEDIRNWRRQIEFLKSEPGYTGQRNHPTPLKIKASGGIRQLTQAIELINAGADRLGASQTAQWVLEQRNP